jgi:hypothetical protein
MARSEPGTMTMEFIRAREMEVLANPGATFRQLLHPGNSASG